MINCRRCFVVERHQAFVERVASAAVTTSIAVPSSVTMRNTGTRSVQTMIRWSPYQEFGWATQLRVVGQRAKAPSTVSGCQCAVCIHCTHAYAASPIPITNTATLTTRIAMALHRLAHARNNARYH